MVSKQPKDETTRKGGEGIEKSFEDCKTYGDMIDFLVEKFTGEAIGTFVLYSAAKVVKANNVKIKEFKKTLIKKSLEEKYNSLYVEVEE